MKLIWNGHSCFTLATEAGTLVIDPYEDGSVPGLSPLHLEADAVYCSHEHRDHGNRAAVALSGKPCAVEVEELATWHDEVQGAKRGPNTMRIFSAEGLRVAHLGDLGCGLTPEQAEALSGLDALLIPVGGFYTIDAGQAKAVVDQLKPRVVVPMHYRGKDFGYEVIGPVEDSPYKLNDNYRKILYMKHESYDILLKVRKSAQKREEENERYKNVNFQAAVQ